MSPRARIPLPERRSRRAAVLVLALLAAMIVSPPAARPAHAQAADSSDAFQVLRGRRRVLLETRDGRLLGGRPLEIRPDSLLMRHPVARYRDPRFALARTDVTRAWVRKNDGVRTALVFAATGFARGSLLEAGLGSTRPGLGFDARDVLVQGLAAAAIELPLGAVIGTLWPRWTQAVPPPGPGESAGSEPYPAWGATVTGGAVRPFASDGGGARPAGTVAVWKNTGRNGSWGFETGTLSWTRMRYVDSYDGIVELMEDRWSYSTFHLRTRLGRTGFRPLVTFGFGAYLHSRAFDDSQTDSAGVGTHYTTRFTESHFGGNLGVGCTWGRGTTRPDVEARFHYAHSGDSADGKWITLEAGLTFP